ncbi:MAG: hypothetical protein RLZZ121_382 [Bacteroidota bacterium]
MGAAVGLTPSPHRFVWNRPCLGRGRASRYLAFPVNFCTEGPTVDQLFTKSFFIRVIAALYGWFGWVRYQRPRGRFGIILKNRFRGRPGYVRHGMFRSRLASICGWRCPSWTQGGYASEGWKSASSFERGTKPRGLGFVSKG